MTRTQRVFTLMQILKENRYPITAEVLADKLQVRLIHSLLNVPLKTKGQLLG